MNNTITLIRKMGLRILVLMLFTVKFTGIQAQSETVTTNKKGELSDTLRESSGLVLVQGHLFSHNDSGNDPDLYEIDTATGKTIFTYHVINAKNVDWEDITSDNSFIYIGDIGNNNGNRKDLCIYKIPLAQIFNRQSNLTAYKISFSYSDQTDFTAKPYATNFDAEGLASVGNKLFIFTKDWGDFKSRIYSCPKDTGNYTLIVMDSFNSGGLITGASYNRVDSIIWLCGYTFTTAFLVKMQLNISQNKIASFSPYELSKLNGFQVEGISAISKSSGFLSCEKNQLSNASLFKYNLSSKNNAYNIDINELKVSVYPNPFRQTFDIQADFEIEFIEIYTLNNALIFSDYYNKFTSEIEKNLPENTVFILHLFSKKMTKNVKKIVVKY